jgi:hypothetical protein
MGEGGALATVDAEGAAAVNEADATVTGADEAAGGGLEVSDFAVSGGGDDEHAAVKTTNKAGATSCFCIGATG